ncbi:MAG: hypothetical protein R3Y53_03265 [Bacillota bacterium]
MNKKIVAPVVIAALIILYLTAIVLSIVPFSPASFFAIVVILAIIGVVIHVTSQRIEEIRSGEEDDLSKY